MNRPTRSLGLAIALGFGLALIGPATAQARPHKAPCAPAPKAGCHGQGLKLSLPKLGHGCGLKLPKLGLGHRKAAPACEPAYHAGPATFAPASTMPSAPIPSHQGGVMPGYGAPGIGMPSAPGMMPGYGAPMQRGFGLGMPPVPGM